MSLKNWLDNGYLKKADPTKRDIEPFLEHPVEAEYLNEDDMVQLLRNSNLS